MSVLIKGLKMPEEGHVFVVFVDRSKHYVLYNDMRYPIIELPDHGDLIDMDALKDKAEFIGDAFSGRGGFAVWGTDVVNAHVVIPAERSEE